MAALGRVIVEAIVHHYGREEVLRRLAHPFWFQSFGAVMGMDWHSSGITTSVIGALKRGLGPMQNELGLYVCGGRGKHSRQTPAELTQVGEATGLDAAPLTHASRLVAKVDSAAVQDGFDLYLHAFVVTSTGHWCVVQQGMNGQRREARRYHWISEHLSSFLDSPHAAIAGANQGSIVNLADARAARSRAVGLELVNSGPDRVVRELRRLRSSPAAALRASPAAAARASPVTVLRDGPAAALPKAAPVQQSLWDPAPAALTPLERALAPPAPGELVPHLQMPAHHDVRASDVVLKRLHGTLAAAADRAPQDFTELLMTPGVGARTVAALALVAEVVYGAPSRFSDPARFSLAHGGKDGHPFPVPLRVYDETIRVLKSAVANAKLGRPDRLFAIQRLDAQARALERLATGPSFESFVAEERARSPEYGGRTVGSGHGTNGVG
jgi:hypothetical protein